MLLDKFDITEPDAEDSVVTEMKFHAAPMEDFMIWAAYQGGEPNIPLLKEYVGDFVRMTVQKSSGQQKSTRWLHLGFENCERVRMTIITEGIKIVRSGFLDSLQDGISERPATLEEYPTWDFLFNSRWHKRDINQPDSILNCLKPRAQAFDKHVLKTAVENCIKVLQYGMYTLDEELYKNAVLCETVALVISGKLDDSEQEARRQMLHEAKGGADT